MCGKRGRLRARLTRRQVGQHGGHTRGCHEHWGAGSRSVQKGSRVSVGGLARALGQRQALIHFPPLGTSLTCREERQASREESLCPLHRLSRSPWQVLLLGLQTPLFRVRSQGQIRGSSGWNDRVRRGAESRERGPCHARRDLRPNPLPAGQESASLIEIQ